MFSPQVAKVQPLSYCTCFARVSPPDRKLLGASKHPREGGQRGGGHWGMRALGL